MSIKNIRLSILDQSPVRKGTSSATAVQETITLAKLADQLGYTRFWVSEHHNTTSLAGSSPEVLIAHLAGETKQLRIGSGGVMLPNHSALKVAENFRMLEVLFPGRIDLGLGRAPGTDRITAGILNPSNQWKEQDFIDQLTELNNFLHDRQDTSTIHARIIAMPKAETAPPMWLLSSSGQSGIFAAHFGMGMSFAHFINPVGGPEAVKAYRDRFQPSPELKQPEVNISAFVFCSEDEEIIAQQEALMHYRFLQLEKGRGLTPVSYNEIKDIIYTEEDKQRIAYHNKRMFTGTPKTLKPKLDALIEQYQVDELIAVTTTERFEDRIRSYEFLAEMYL